MPFYSNYANRKKCKFNGYFTSKKEISINLILKRISIGEHKEIINKRRKYSKTKEMRIHNEGNIIRYVMGM